MTFHTPERRAVHEAGHVIVAYTIGWAFEFVTLQQHPRYLNLWGYVQYSRPLETRADLDLWAPTFLAGQFSEALLLGFAGPGASHDTTMVMEQIGLHLGRGSEGAAFFHEASHRAREIVALHQEATRAIAEALVKSETLHRDEVEAVVTVISPPRSGNTGG
jgi:hypothetical protein